MKYKIFSTNTAFYFEVFGIYNQFVINIVDDSYDSNCM